MRRLKVVAVLLGVAAMMALAACGSSKSNSSSSTSGGSNTTASSSRAVSIDVGLGRPIVVHTNKPRIAFLGTSGNLLLKAQIQGVQDEAKARGVDLTVFDSKFDPTVQMQQVQNALQQKRFDAFIVVPLDSNAMCPVLTRQAVAQGIPVVTNNVPLCNRVSKPEGDQLWSPGTIAHVGWTATVDANRSMYREVNRRVGPGVHTAALLVGPPLIGGTISSIAALRQSEAAGEIPHLNVKYVINTDFTTPDGLAKTQTLLQAHPDVDTIMTIYSDTTIGAIKAVQAAGKEGKVKLYDQGASGQSLAAIRAGQLEMTTAFFPYTFGKQAVDAVVDAFEGKRVPRWIGQYVQGSTPGNPLVIDKSNINSFRPEY